MLKEGWCCRHRPSFLSQHPQRPAPNRHPHRRDQWRVKGVWWLGTIRALRERPWKGHITLFAPYRGNFRFNMPIFPGASPWSMILAPDGGGNANRQHGVDGFAIPNRHEWCIFRHRNGPTGIMFACILLPPTGANNTKNEISHNLCENYNHLTQSEIQNSHNLWENWKSQSVTSKLLKRCTI